MTKPIHIVADYREVPSKVPELLEEQDVDIELCQLKIGDYVIDNEILVERKTREDFVMSIIQGRLFEQCSRMKKTDKHVAVLIEGNPYHTKHDIDRQAVKGALLSVSVCWQILIIYSADASDTAQTLIMLASQLLKENHSYFRKSKNPKTYKRKAIYFLQGLPNIGPVLAKALLDKFGSIQNVMLADEEELLAVEGLGKKKAKSIRMFLGGKFGSGQGKE